MSEFSVYASDAYSSLSQKGARVDLTPIFRAPPPKQPWILRHRSFDPGLCDGLIQAVWSTATFSGAPFQIRAWAP